MVGAAGVVVVAFRRSGRLVFVFRGFGLLVCRGRGPGGCGCGACGFVGGWAAGWLGAFRSAGVRGIWGPALRALAGVETRLRLRG